MAETKPAAAISSPTKACFYILSQKMIEDLMNDRKFFNSKIFFNGRNISVDCKCFISVDCKCFDSLSFILDPSQGNVFGNLIYEQIILNDQYY